MCGGGGWKAKDPPFYLGGTLHIFWKLVEVARLNPCGPAFNASTPKGLNLLIGPLQSLVCPIKVSPNECLVWTPLDHPLKTHVVFDPRHFYLGHANSLTATIVPLELRPPPSKA